MLGSVTGLVTGMGIPAALHISQTIDLNTLTPHGMLWLDQTLSSFSGHFVTHSFNNKGHI